MPNRTIAIGDIHGCLTALAALLDAIDPQPDDVIVTLGDYIDRGTDSKGVLDQLIQLERRCRLVPLLGNHEEMMLGAREGKSDFAFWMNCGGITALDSYGSTGQLDLIPREHFQFVERCRLFYETDTHFFAHANYKRDVPLDRQDRHTLLWLLLTEHLPRKHVSGKVAVLGHTLHLNGEILDLPHLKCIDTGCGSGGMMTALDVESGRLWQVDEKGS